MDISTCPNKLVLADKYKTGIKGINGIKGFIPLAPQERSRSNFYHQLDTFVVMPPKGLSGRPPESTIHTFYERDRTSAANNPIYRCNGCNEAVRGKDPSKLFAHKSSCPNTSDEDREKVRIAFTEYQARKEAKRIASMEADSSGSGASSGAKKRKETGPLDRHIDMSV